MQPDEFYMRRALELAERGAGKVSPNPMVGCVVVSGEKIIGEGWHQEYGGPHAEVNAVNTIRDRSAIPGAMVYVSLEPCSHFGKTPPCTDLLIHQKVGKVIIGCLDPNPLVNGMGRKKLMEAGIEVEISGISKEAGDLNKRFFTSKIKCRPYIILKWAQTSDHFIARNDYSSKWISSPLSRQWVHRWRSEEDAVLVGRTTAEKDNAALTVRDWKGRNPIRVLISQSGKIDPSWNIFDKAAPTLCYISKGGTSKTTGDMIHLHEQNFIPELLSDLQRRGINSVLVEGGANTIKSFIESGLWDEARIFTAPGSFGEGISAPQLTGIKTDQFHSGPDLVEIIRHPDSFFSNLQTVE
jgi:diaminohydroxyphosphoribosylaminopyrimidine deaminase/5-amino-6-(5-phosphoribosylamino)uracil reductase